MPNVTAPPPFRPLALAQLAHRAPELAKKLEQTKEPGDAFATEAQVKALTPAEQELYAAVARADKRFSVATGVGLVTGPLVTIAATIATGGVALPLVAGYSIMAGSFFAFDKFGWPEQRA
ncbi:MAG: hypothetical protein JNK82_39670 [Myxococcaceae bacterium]|nr:hypothetical protein [Myxococcaceae bacterium]